jgi:hypothetical protein
MGNIGRFSQRYDVLPVPRVSLADADRWSVPARMTVPSPEPMPAPYPGPTPEPVPTPGPDPTPGSDPAPVPSDTGLHRPVGWLARAARALR